MDIKEEKELCTVRKILAERNLNNRIWKRAVREQIQAEIHEAYSKVSDSHKVTTVNPEKIREGIQKLERCDYLVDWVEYPYQPTWES